MSDLSDWEQKAHYETEDGDRATLLQQGEEWAVCWSYPYPHNGTQVVPYGQHRPSRGCVYIVTDMTGEQKDALMAREAIENPDRWLKVTAQ
ncbi:hypothetical protein [Streptomyces sp. NPDC059651]|uniref:hypothetical protein n=1 Tax=Streptomyces sp. NPDC059651 TaxID=3346897 RepID=UPI0036909EC2